jgi:hypothetical protein
MRRAYKKASRPKKKPTRASHHALLAQLCARLAIVRPRLTTLAGKRLILYALRYLKYAMSGVSVNGLSNVDAKTTLVTNAGATSNSKARMVVTTAAGIDASKTPA